jgi:hypothetical protein
MYRFSKIVITQTFRFFRSNGYYYLHIQNEKVSVRDKCLKSKQTNPLLDACYSLALNEGLKRTKRKG